MSRPKDIPANHQARTGDGKIISATTGVVPILRELEPGKLQVIGTGFYVTRYGLFLTARHVFDHIVKSDSPGRHSLRILHDTGNALHIRPVTRISYSHYADVALAEADNFISQFPEQPLRNLRPILTLRHPVPGSNLVVFAYPRNALLDFTVDKSSCVEMFADRFEGQFECIREPGKYDAHQVEAYQTTVPIEGGASGAPAFDSEGRIVGVVQSSIDFGVGEHEGVVTSFLTPLRHALDLGFNNLMLSEGIWEYQQIPSDRKHEVLTLRDLAAFGHLILDHPVD
ncbi:S1 family peptidase [Pelagibius litoralis]|nr:serine protease [Pelagibius litoralis]